MTTESPPLFKRLNAFEVLLLIVAVVGARLVAARVCHIYDDAFITYRYALNLARGAGLVFNPGAEWEPVLGTTTPGYAVWLSWNAQLGLEIVKASLFWNFLFDAISAFLLISLFERERVRSTIAVLAFASLPELARISAGGMEAPMLCMLALAASASVRARRYALAGTLAALCCTLRPEAVLLVGLLGLGAIRDRRQLVRFAMPVALIGVSYAATLIMIYGSPIPQSVVSKASVHGDSPTLATWGEILRQGFLPRMLYLPALPFVLFGLVRSLRAASALTPVLRFGLGIVLAYLIARPHTWGWYYYIPLTAWVIWLALGLAPCIEFIAGRATSVARIAEKVGTVAATLGAAAFVWFGTAKMTDDVSQRVYAPMAEWVRSVAADQRKLELLASDIGAISYFASLYDESGDDALIYDSQGLTWPGALDFASQMDAISAHQPEYLLLTAERAEIGPMREREDVTRAYYPIRRFSVTGETELEPMLAELPGHWMQDYLLYRRRL